MGVWGGDETRMPIGALQACLLVFELVFSSINDTSCFLLFLLLVALTFVVVVGLEIFPVTAAVATSSPGPSAAVVACAYFSVPCNNWM